MAGKNQVTLTFAGDSRDLERAFDRVGRSARDMDRHVDRVDANMTRRPRAWSKAITAFGGIAGIALAGAATAAVGFGLSLVEAAEESQKVTKQTAAVIKSMGNVAGISAEQVAELAEKLSLKSGIDDELIQSGQNVLLTFANIRNEVGRGNDIFTRATTAALDMSVALGQDMQSSVVMLGKALNDPIKGITTLGRAGIQFSEDQKAMIAALVESGDLLGAQKIIIGEVERQFTGSAEAQATASDKLKTAFGNLQEALGEKLLPKFQEWTQWIIDEGIPRAEELWAEFETRLWPKLQDGAEILDKELRPAFMKLVGAWREHVLPAIGPLLEAFGKVHRALSGTEDKSSDLALGIKFLGGVLAAGLFGPRIFATALGWIITAISKLIGWIAGAVGAIRNFFGLLASIPGRIRDAFQNALGGLGGGISSLVGWVGNLFGAKGGLVTTTAIQRFAVGGIAGFRGRGRDSIPAMLSPREMVLTLTDQKNLLSILGGRGRGVGGGGRSVTVNLYVQGSIRSERDLVKIVRDEIGRGGFGGAFT